MFNFSVLFYCSTNGKTSTWFCCLTNQEASIKFCHFTSLILLLGELGGIGTVFLFNKLATFHSKNKFHLFITLYLFVCVVLLLGA